MCKSLPLNKTGSAVELQGVRDDESVRELVSVLISVNYFRSEYGGLGEDPS